MIDKLKDDFFNEVKSYILDKKDLELIDKCLKYALSLSDEVIHFDGSLYILHVLRTATLLAELHSDALCLASSLVSWTPLLKNISIDEIREKFGEEVADITENIFNINKLKLKDSKEQSAIYLRKVLVGLSSDVRVIIIKLASRLDNLKYVYTEPSETQTEKCIETENVLIPIAHRLGINYIKSQLEDLCLKYLKTDAYNDILNKLDASYDELNGYIKIMQDELSQLMQENDIEFKIKGRVKSVYSLYGKMSKGKKWKDIYDLLALRIIVKKKSECYLAIGLIHAKYRPIPNRFKDYIAQPKENMYQSLHTGVIGPDGKIFEIQIRTEEMDEIAECGIASHWSYKEQETKSIQNLMERKLELFRDMLDLSSSDDETVESEFKSLFVEEMIYVFTPNGDVIELPIGSTPVDFAYKIHSHIGDTLVGAIVNDEIVPIDYQLVNNDIVKINTSESSNPKKEWLKFVKTTQAKSRIKAYFSKQDREEYIAHGEELINREIKKRHWSLNETLKEENTNKIVSLLKLKDFDEVKLSVGSMRYTANYVMSLLENDKKDVSDLILEKISTSNKKKENYKNDIIVDGCDNILVTMANCCRPVYGDEIIGYITRGDGIVVHKANCVNLKNMDSRFIDVSWNEKTTNNYIARILIKTNSLNNNILSIVTKSSQRNISIDSINSLDRPEGIDYEITIKVPNTELLKQFMLDIEAMDFVFSVERENK